MQPSPSSPGQPAPPPPPPVKLKRGSVACKRCRRLRSKCAHHNAAPPCASCRDAGPAVAADCVFPRRGEDASDREASRGAVLHRPHAHLFVAQFRRKRLKLADRPERQAAAGSSLLVVPKTESGSPPALAPAPDVADQWSLLPPYEEVVEGCNVLVKSYFQLGPCPSFLPPSSVRFIPKAMFLERLATDRASVSVFLLLAILSLSARFTPCLAARFGDPVRATEHFMRQAARLVPREMYRPSLERTQAFFLLSVTEWGHGDRDRSFMHMGIAVRMAGLLRLHREETYRLPPDAPAEDVIASEAARRTFWMIASQDNLQSATNTPAPFAPRDISALLPCAEQDFAFGSAPRARAALAGTAAARAAPALVGAGARSLFAVLIQAHHLWGRVARRACQWESDLPEPAGAQGHGRRDDLGSQSVAPWEEESEYAGLKRALGEWERGLPERHRWSIRNLRGYRAESLDLAYLAVVMVLRLSNIVMRRIYLPFIASAVKITEAPWTESSDPAWAAVPARFWEDMASELFADVCVLYEQIDAYFPLRANGFPPIIVFCVYICGSLASYLWKWPQLCPALAPRAEEILQRTLSVLTELQHAWPKARVWQASLRRAAVGLPESSTSVPPSSSSIPPSPPPGVHERPPGGKAPEAPLEWAAPGSVPRQQQPGGHLHVTDEPFLPPRRYAYDGGGAREHEAGPSASSAQALAGPGAPPPPPPPPHTSNGMLYELAEIATQGNGRHAGRPLLAHPHPHSHPHPHLHAPPPLEPLAHAYPPLQQQQHQQALAQVPHRHPQQQQQQAHLPADAYYRLDAPSLAPPLPPPQQQQLMHADGPASAATFSLDSFGIAWNAFLEGDGMPMGCGPDAEGMLPPGWGV